jgi:glycosyltransferase involved in cell wall biosynthesis
MDLTLAQWASPYAGVRVVHIVDDFSGARLEIVRTIAERAAAAGHPQAIAHGRRPETPAALRAEIDPAVALFEVDWRGEAAIVDRLRQIVREWEADVVHLHSSLAGAVGALALAGRVPLVWTPHGMPSHKAGAGAERETARELERMVACRVQVIGAMSETEADLAEELAPGRTRMIPGGIAELDGDRAPRPDGRAPRVIAGGRLVSRRRAAACARILGPLRDAAEVAWIGGGSSDAARDALTEAGIPVSGWVPRTTVLDELGRSAVYLHWTSSDVLPVAVLEAMARGAVVVASDTPANREVLDPRQLCRTEPEARALIRYLLADEQFADELRAGQDERAWMFSASRMAGAWTRLYRDVAGLPAAGARRERRRSLSLA